MKTKSLNTIWVTLMLLFTFTICSCSDDNPNQPGPDPEINTVTGKVIDEVGIGLVNVTVVIGNQFTSTSSDGSFIIPDVTAPYDLKVVQGIVGIEYKSLTTMTPQVLGIGITEQLRQCQLTVSIPSSKFGTGKKAAVIFTDTISVQRNDSLDGNVPFDTTATFDVKWKGNSQISGKIIVMIYSVDNNGHVSQFDLYGQRLTTLNDGSNVTIPFGENDLPVPSGNSTVSGSLSVPGGYTDATAKLSISFLNTNIYTSSTQYIQLSYIGIATQLDSKPGPAYVLTVPSNLPTSNKLIVTGFAKSSNAPGNNATTSRSINCVPGSSNNNITLETVPPLITPNNGSTANLNTNFSHSPGSTNGIYVVTYVSYDNPQRLFYTFTSSTGSQIPDLSQYSLGIIPGKNYFWFVSQFLGVNSTDDLLSRPLVNNNNLTGTVITDAWTFTSTSPVQKQKDPKITPDVMLPVNK
jgi:hypothetical protein